MDMILKNTFQSVSPAYELIGDVTVGTNTTQVDFNGLNVGKDDELLLVSYILNPTTSWNQLNLLANNNATLTNYYVQSLHANHSTIAAERSNSPTLSDNQGGSGPNKNVSITNIKLTNSGYFMFQSNESDLWYSNNSQILLQDYHGTSTFTSASITQLTVKSSVTNAIGVGSRFQLYKLVAEKVADIIVPSNTTSVDITGLNIGKDGEYYLTGNVVGVNGPYIDILMYANNNTTGTNYYNQEIVAYGTTVASGRANNPYITYVDTGQNTFFALNLKLTNSGYPTSQVNYTRNYVGGTSIFLGKKAWTTTFTANEITQLTIVAMKTNAIGANSRFTLYKMK